MGTIGSYSGGGGRPGRDLRQGVDEWLDDLPEAPPSEPPTDRPEDDGAPGDQPQQLPNIPAETILNVLPMFRPRSGGGGDGPGGVGAASGSGGSQRPSSASGGGGGAQRSAARSASSAGRAAAGAYAFRTGDTATLEALGLDYAELSSSGDAIEVTQKIVEAACGQASDGTIEDEERRKVAAEVAEWVLEENAGGVPPNPEEIVRETIARIIFEAATTEAAQQLRAGKRPAWATREGERQIRECAEVLARRAELTATGPTVEEFEKAIEQGIETLRELWGTA